ncbi:MAG: NAD(P)H-dependent oxidoreductase subunit E [Candidatus Cloacimonetes bacterium]|nr:NAD(P)H-dependent oxidoreductase subunit E [Candidatus Cloacimonadota bacterium]MDD4155922.1 NAD(P)H-dependent oxidoreductase subunit E [Candidatus Cloacimonadota bacterium]
MLLTEETLDNLYDKYSKSKGFLIPLLQEAQQIEGYLSKEIMQKISHRFNLKIADIYGVATFYSMFRLKPQGQHTIKICKGTACHVSGADLIITAVKNSLKLQTDEDTSSDNLFTVSEVACLGCCSLAPAMMIDDKTYGNLSPDKASAIVEELKQKFSK